MSACPAPRDVRTEAVGASGCPSFRSPYRGTGWDRACGRRRSWIGTDAARSERSHARREAASQVLAFPDLDRSETRRWRNLAAQLVVDPARQRLRAGLQASVADLGDALVQVGACPGSDDAVQRAVQNEIGRASCRERV